MIEFLAPAPAVTIVLLDPVIELMPRSHLLTCTQHQLL